MMKFAIVTTDSYKGTALYQQQINDYDQTRAHGMNIIKLAEELGVKQIYDVGWHNHAEIYDDYHKDRLPDIYISARSRKIGMVEIHPGDLLHESEFNTVVVFVLYYCMTEENTNLLRFIFDNFKNVIYYTSDNEYYNKDYFLNRLINKNLVDFNLKSLRMILSGHSYSYKFPKIIDRSYYYPMIPDMKMVDKPLIHNPFKQTYDVFINCHHTSQDVENLFDLPISLLIFSNTHVGKYIEERVKFDKLESKVKVIKSEGRNLPIKDIIGMIKRCRLVYIQNTYHHIHPWYKEHYNQMTMYTHKLIEAFYADRPSIGDINPMGLFEFLRAVRGKTRTEIYQELSDKGIVDPVIKVNEYVEMMTPVIARDIKEISI